VVVYYDFGIKDIKDCGYFSPPFPHESKKNVSTSSDVELEKRRTLVIGIEGTLKGFILNLESPSKFNVDF